MVIVQDNQTLFDIAILNDGTCDSAFDWAVANGISITDDLLVGTNMVLSTSIFTNDDIANYFKARNHMVATALTLDHNMLVAQTGIGTMTIESTFIIA